MSEKRTRDEIAIDHQEGRAEMQLWTMIVLVENLDVQREIDATRRIAVISDGEPQGIGRYHFAVDGTVHGYRHEYSCLIRTGIDGARRNASPVFLPAMRCSSL